jgi:hypothetical protein
MRYVIHPSIVATLCVLSFMVGYVYNRPDDIELGAIRGGPQTGFTLYQDEQISIGTTTPNQDLTIFDRNDDPGIELTATSGRYTWTIGVDYSAGGKFTVSSSTAPGTSDRLVIDGQGDLGVGTSSPRYRTDIFSTATTSVRIDSSARGGCLIIADVDRSGYTFCNYNNGSQTCSSTDICK